MQVMRNVTSAYVAACRELRVHHRAPAGAGAALLHASAARAGAVLLVCKPGQVARAHCAAAIARLDAASQGVLLERIAPLSIDAQLSELSVRVAGAKPPLLSVANLSVSGMLIRARQLTAPPLTTQQVFWVGRLHQAPVQATVKGCRAPMKSYTDFKIEAEEVEVAGGIGLEPLMGQLVKAMKQRIIPPDALNPDGTVPVTLPGSGASITPWDKMRYVWRGALKVQLRNIKASLAAGLSMLPSTQEPCIQLTAATLGLAINTGRLDVTSTALSVVGLGIPPEGSPGDPLLLLPFCHAPLLTASLHTSWVVPPGRDAAQHHVFPLLRDAPPGPEEVQEPVDVASLVRSEGLVLGVDINLAAGGCRQHRHSWPQRTPAGSGGAAATAPTSRHRGSGSGSGSISLMSRHFTGGWQGLAASHTTRLYLGELQVSFLRQLVRTFATAPPSLRNSIKKRCFYEPRRPVAEGGAPTPSEPETAVQQGPPPLSPAALLTRLDINAAADVLEVHHDAQDPEDLSDFVFLRAHGVRFAGNFSYTRSVVSILRGERMVPRWARQAASSSLSLEASDLMLVRPHDDHQGGGGVSATEHTRAKEASSAGGRPGSEPGGAPGSSLLAAPLFGEGLICSASRLQLRLAPASKGPAARDGSQQQQQQQGWRDGADTPAAPAKRPLRMVVQDVQLYGSALLRDTCMATAMHIISAFTSHPPPPPPHAARPGQAHTFGNSGSAAGGAHSSRGGRGSGGARSGGHATDAQGAAGSVMMSGAASDVQSMGPQGHGSTVVATKPALSPEAILHNEAQLLSQLMEARSRRMAGGVEALGGHGQGPETPPSQAGHDAMEPDLSTRSMGAASDHSGTTDDMRPMASHGSVTSVGTSASTAAAVAARAAASPEPQSAQVEEQLVFEMEFVRVQVAVVAVGSPGAFLFATNSARLASVRSNSTGTTKLTTSFMQLQAYAVRQAGEAGSRTGAIPWLAAQGGRLVAHSATAVGSTVMSPFNLDIIHTRQVDNGVQRGVAGSASSDLTIQVPSVEGVLEPWQFETLLDVIQNVLMCPPPQVSMLLPSSAPQPALDSASGVVAAQEVVAALTQQLCCLHRELLTVAPAVLKTLWGRQGSSNLSGEWFHPGSASPHQLLSALMAPASGMSGAARARQQSREVLLVWCVDQVSGAADSVDAARALLARERSQAALLAHSSSNTPPTRRGGPLSATVVLGAFSWALSNRQGAVFVSAELEGLEYTSALDRNYVGTTRLALRSITLREAAAAPPVNNPLAAAAALSLPAPTTAPAAPTKPPRLVLSLWQPGRPAAIGGAGASPPPSLKTSSYMDNARPTAASGAGGTGGTSAASQDSGAAAGGGGGGGGGGEVVVAGGGDWGQGQRGVGAGWDQELAVSVAAVHGGLEPPNFVVYDHIEVVLHPLQLHLTYALALQLQDYFALDETAPTPAPTPSAASTSVGPLTAASMPLPPLPTLPHLPPSGLGRQDETAATGMPSGSPNKGWFHRRGGSGTVGQPGAGPLAVGAAALAGASGSLSRHAQSSSAGGGGGGGGAPLTWGSQAAHDIVVTGMRGRSHTADNVTAGEPNRYGAVYRRRSRQASARGASSNSASGGGGGAGATSGAGDAASRAAGPPGRRGLRKAATIAAAGSTKRRGGTGGGTHVAADTAADTQSLQSIPRSRLRYRFKHVRFNRMHVRLTYEGPPIGVNDFRLVLDHSAYVNVEGTWKTLLNKYKWDVVRSILKSMTGLQKGKVAELERGLQPPLVGGAQGMGGGGGGAAGLMGPGDVGRGAGKGGALRQNLRALLGMGQSKPKAGAAGVGRATEDAALAQLIHAAELMQQRQARLALLLGNVPPPPARKLLLE